MQSLESPDKPQTDTQPHQTVPTSLPSARATTDLSMRHRNKLKKLGLPADQRKALMRSLTTEVIRHGRIKTTLIRAKAVR